MKLSIITPSFNQGEFVSRCFASVKTQQGVEIEHIVLDNCSSDSSIEIIRDYERNSGGVLVKAIVERDAGQTAAINRGFSLATGDVVCWLNTDEFYSKGALQTVAAYFEANSDVDVLFGDFSYVDRNGVVLKYRRAHGYSRSMLLYYGCYIPSCSTFIRRRVISAGNLLDTSFAVTMDFEYYVRLASLGYRFAHIPAFLASFTLHDKNISVTQLKKRRQERRIVQDRFSGLYKWQWFRSIAFTGLLVFWIAFRSLERCVYRLRGSVHVLGG